MKAHSGKKLLILIEWFTPGYKAGGPIQSCVNMCIALKENYDIYVLTTDTDHGETQPYVGIEAESWISDSYTGAHIYYTKKSSLTFKKIWEIINSINADFIHLNLFFSPTFVLYPLWLKYTKKIKAKVILCPRGTLYDSAISLKWYVKRPFLLLVKLLGIDKKIIFHATNEREKKTVCQYFPKSKIVIADNLPNTLQPSYISCPKTVGNLKCIFIARIVPIKNLIFLLRLLGSMQGKITLTIIGPIENDNYWVECKLMIAQLPSNIYVSYEGPKKNSELPALLQRHHLFILPTTGENFGHAIFEALLAGRPVLISDQTPWQDLFENNAGWIFPLSDPERFVAVLNDFLHHDQHQQDLYAKAAWHYASKFLHEVRLNQPYKRLFI